MEGRGLGDICLTVGQSTARGALTNGIISCPSRQPRCGRLRTTDKKPVRASSAVSNYGVQTHALFSTAVPFSYDNYGRQLTAQTQTRTSQFLATVCTRHHTAKCVQCAHQYSQCEHGYGSGFSPPMAHHTLAHAPPSSTRPSSDTHTVSTRTASHHCAHAHAPPSSTCPRTDSHTASTRTASRHCAYAHAPPSST